MFLSFIKIMFQDICLFHGPRCFMRKFLFHKSSISFSTTITKILLSSKFCSAPSVDAIGLFHKDVLCQDKEDKDCDQIRKVTSRNQPTEAWCLFLVWQVFQIKDLRF